jgi:plastocyanin
MANDRSTAKGDPIMKRWFGVTLVTLTLGFGWAIALSGAYQSAPAATPAAATASAAGSRLEIKQFRFSQPALTVPVGATVTWVNQDDDAHTVTADDGGFTSAGLDHGEVFAHQFTASGTYAYHCALHPKMTAKIVVQ